MVEETETAGTWERVAEHLHVHSSGARIERRGFPNHQGWYLVAPSRETLRFDATSEGCDRAFLAFEGRRKARP